MIPPVMLIASIFVVLRVARVFSTKYSPGENFSAGPSCCPCCSPSFDNMDEFFFAPDCNMAGSFILLLL